MRIKKYTMNFFKHKNSPIFKLYSSQISINIQTNHIILCRMFRKRCARIFFYVFCGEFDDICDDIGGVYEYWLGDCEYVWLWIWLYECECDIPFDTAT